MILCASSLPQIAKTFRTKSSNDLSILYLVSLLLGMSLMMIYSLHVGDLVFIIGNALSVFSTVVLTGLSLRYRRTSVTAGNRI